MSDSESVASLTAKAAKLNMKVVPKSKDEAKEKKTETYKDYSEVPFPTKVSHTYKNKHMATADWVSQEKVVWGTEQFKSVTAFVIAHNKVLNEQGKHPSGCQEGIWQTNNTKFLKDGSFIPLKSIVKVGFAADLEETPAPGSIKKVANPAGGGGGGGGGPAIYEEAESEEEDKVFKPIAKNFKKPVVAAASAVEELDDQKEEPKEEPKEAIVVAMPPKPTKKKEDKNKDKEGV